MKGLQIASAALAMSLALTVGLVAAPGLALGASMAAAVATPTADEASSARTIAVVGHGEVAVTPDLARVAFGVETTGTEVAAAQAENAARASAVLDRLKALSIAAQDLQTSGYRISPEYDRDNNRTGFRVTNQIGATVRDLGALGAIIDGAVAAGANRIAGIAFDVANRDQALQAARAAAVRDARARAEHYMRLTGVTLGEPRTIAENAGVPLSELPTRQVAAGDTPIAPGEGALAITIRISYAIR